MTLQYGVTLTAASVTKAFEERAAGNMNEKASNPRGKSDEATVRCKLLLPDVRPCRTMSVPSSLSPTATAVQQTPAIQWSFKVSTPEAKFWLCAKTAKGRRRWICLIKSRATRLSYLKSLKVSLLERFPKLELVRPASCVFRVAQMCVRLPFCFHHACRM